MQRVMQAIAGMRVVEPWPERAKRFSARNGSASLSAYQLQQAPGVRTTPHVGG
jgi:hypothetical protein